jgi:hypothetical protein
MTIKQELRKLTGERHRLIARISNIDIREGQLLARINVAAKAKSLGAAAAKKTINPKGKSK